MTRALRTQRRRARRGFTLVEVMIALAVLALGVTGILSLQNASILSNRRAQEMTVATHVARLWMERLHADALQWNRPTPRNLTSDLTDTRWLCRAAATGCTTGGGPAINQWFVPSIPPPHAAALGPSAFDFAAREVSALTPEARYCVSARLTWVVRDIGPRQGMLRAEVRVWWYQEGAPNLYPNCADANPGQQNAISRDATNIHAVYLGAVIAGHVEATP